MGLQLLGGGGVSEEDLASPLPAMLARKPVEKMPPGYNLARIAQTGHGWTGGAADDTTVKQLGDLSYRAVTNGSGGSLYLSSATFTARDLTKYALRVMVRISDATRVQTFQVYVDSASGTSNAYVGNVQFANVIRSGEWQIFTIPRASFSVVAGTPDWAAVTGVRLRFQDKGGSAPFTVYTHGVDLLPDYAHLYPNGVFVLEADDGYASQKSLLLPLCDALGVPVTLPIITDRITGGAAGITASDLRAFQLNGHQPTCHAMTTTFHNNASATAAEAEADFIEQQNWLADEGLHAGALDYALCPGSGPTTFVTDADKLAAIKRRFRSARTTAGFTETILPAEPHQYRAVLFSGNSNANLQTNIDWASGPGGVLTLALHEVLSGGTNGTASSLPAIAVNNLKTVLQYAAGKGMAFRTRTDLLNLR